MSETMKSCPFCGGQADSTCRYGEYRVGCKKCDIFFYGKTPSEAFGKWNKRHRSAEPAEPTPPENPEFADDILRAQGITTAHCGFCRFFLTHLEIGGRMWGWQGSCTCPSSKRGEVEADDYCEHFKALAKERGEVRE